MNMRFRDFQDTSWVNLFTNEVFLKDINPSSLSNIIIGQKLPKEIFFSFIHEAMHNWCFYSNVGNALFLTRIRAYSKSNKIINTARIASTDERWDIYTDYIRFISLQRILQPLIEGMALFSEYDSFPTDTEVIPPPLLYCSLVFCGIPKDKLFKNGNTIEKIEGAYKEFLYERRFKGGGVMRKSELLVSSICVSQSPYLAGYLTIKNIQLMLLESSPRFIDPNLFLYFLWTYLFNDYGLIDLLLNDQIKDEMVPVSLCQYLANRIDNIRYLPRDTIDHFEKDIVAGAGIPDTYRLLTPEKIVKSAITKLTDGAKYMQEEAGLDSSVMLFMRRLFRVCRLNTYVRITEKHIRIFFSVPASKVATDKISFLLKSGIGMMRGEYLDILSFQLPNEQYLSDFAGEALFEKYLMFSQLEKQVNMFTSGDKVIYYWFEGTWDQTERTTFLGYFINRSRFPDDEDIDRKVHACLEESKLVFNTFETSLYKDLYTQLDEFYKGLAIDCSDELLPLLKERMKDNGFWEVVDKRIDLLDGLSLLSIMCSNGSKPFGLVGVRRDNPLLTELKEVLERNGLPVLMFDNNKIGTAGV